jgi:hypothetical protein
MVQTPDSGRHHGRIKVDSNVTVVINLVFPAAQDR